MKESLSMRSSNSSEKVTQNFDPHRKLSTRPATWSGLSNKNPDFAKKNPHSALPLSSPSVEAGSLKVTGIFQRNPFFQAFPSKTSEPSSHKPLANPTICLTRRIVDTYHSVNPEFRYERQQNPKRVLTKPSKPVFNEGHDNEDHDLILYVNSILGHKEGQRYLVLELLGQGTFGQVARCVNLQTRELVAVKVIKGKEAYYSQSLMEITILDLLNRHYDPHDRHHLIRLYDTFTHHSHLCLVFELLSVSLYDLLKQNKFRGLSPNLIRVFTRQLLDSLCVLSEAHIIHADLKPENIMLKDLDSPEIKVIDFGSACHDQKTFYTYIQSRFYRSPEVIIGLSYTLSVDMWSLGCILVELFLGLPLFPGTSEYNQLCRIVELLGPPPAYMIELGKNGSEYFNKWVGESGLKGYDLKPLDQYNQEKSVQEVPSKRYFPLMPITELIRAYPMSPKLTKPPEIQNELNNRLKFADFILGLLTLNPLERWSPQQARLHPFVTGEPFDGHFQPPSFPRPSPAVNREASTTSHPSISKNGNPFGPPFPPKSDPSRLRGRARATTVNLSAGFAVPAPIQKAAAVAGHSLNDTTNPRRFRIQTEDQKAKRLSMPVNPFSSVLEEAGESDPVSALTASITNLNLTSQSHHPPCDYRNLPNQPPPNNKLPPTSSQPYVRRTGNFERTYSSHYGDRLSKGYGFEKSLGCSNGSSNKSRRTQSFGWEKGFAPNDPLHGLSLQYQDHPGSQPPSHLSPSKTNTLDSPTPGLPDTTTRDPHPPPNTNLHPSHHPHPAYPTRQAGLAPPRHP